MKRIASDSVSSYDKFGTGVNPLQTCISPLFAILRVCAQHEHGHLLQ